MFVLFEVVFDAAPPFGVGGVPPVVPWLAENHETIVALYLGREHLLAAMDQADGWHLEGLVVPPSVDDVGLFTV